MNTRIHVGKELLLDLRKRLQKALGQDRRLAKRILAILEIIDGSSVEATADRLALSERSVRTYLHQFLDKGVESLNYKSPPGRPKKLTKRERKELCEFIDNGPEAAGYDYGCWTTALLEELIQEHFQVTYSVYYIAELLKALGYSYQKARFVSEHIENVSDEQTQWMCETWPEIAVWRKQNMPRFCLAMKPALRNRVRSPTLVRRRANNRSSRLLVRARLTKSLASSTMFPVRFSIKRWHKDASMPNAMLNFSPKCWRRPHSTLS